MKKNSMGIIYIWMKGLCSWYMAVVRNVIFISPLAHVLYSITGMGWMNLDSVVTSGLHLSHVLAVHT